MWTRMVLVTLVVGVIGTADAALLCQKKSGAVVVRDSCKRKETAVSATALPFSDTLPSGKTLRGTFFMTVDATSGGQEIGTSISFGLQLPSEPTVNFMPASTPPTAACPGTPAAPAAQPGHLCIFEASAINLSGQGLCDPGSCDGSPSNRYGILLYAFSAAASTVQWAGTWAVTAP